MLRLSVCPSCNRKLPRIWSYSPSKRHSCPDCNAILRESKKSRIAGRFLAILLLLLFIPSGAAVGATLMESDQGLIIGSIVAYFFVFALAFLIDPYTTHYEQLPPSCHRCGYNLNANTTGICPECGTAVPLALLFEIARTPFTSPTR